MFPDREILVVAPPGLEPIVARELGSLGWAGLRQVPGGVVGVGGEERVWQVCLDSRTAAGVRVRLGRFSAPSLDLLAQGVRRLPLDLFVRPNQEVEVSVSVRGSRLARRDMVARKTTFAIRDALRSRPRPPPGRPPAPARIHVRLVDDQAEVSVDAAGEHLHRRGWRPEGGGAPLRENLAAAVLVAAGWVPGVPLVDPFAGSGTFPIEAAAWSAGLRPGGQRRFAFEDWPSHDPRRWRSFRGRASRARPAAPIAGFDADGPSIARAAQNAERARVADRIRWQVARVDQAFPPGDAPGLVVANPPWGRRLGRDVDGVYVAFGRVLQERFRGWRVALLCPDARLAGRTGLGLEPVLRFPSGGQAVTLWMATVR